MSNRILLSKKDSQISAEISIGGSKSETNRLLILNALYENPIQLSNISDSDDSRLLQSALSSDSTQIDIHHAGTAMRFLTAYFAIQENRTVVLTGSDRMKERPIGVLVDALRSLGAEISYLDKEGFPPLKIQGGKLTTNFVEVEANISSQFITALLLIAPKFPKGLHIQLNGKITSRPYLEMSLKLVNQVGISTEFKGNIIRILPQTNLENKIHRIESDWSSASYFYSIAALSDSVEIKLDTFFSNSLQGDSEVVEIYKNYFGVQTQFVGNQILLSKIPNFNFNEVILDLNRTPDLAQTIAVTCTGLKLKCKLSGLETLKIKETDRLLALQNELAKIGAQVEITNDSLEIQDFFEVSEIPLIKTYNDHRMAMSFAPLVVFQDLEIENPKVVEKSYPNFWEDFEKL
ncbi:MAG: 3-phosphoshikimate 1-carboxyvinyltransferase [Weeksellaceae bacterium]